jgi:hypothetical protein
MTSHPFSVRHSYTRFDAGERLKPTPSSGGGVGSGGPEHASKAKLRPTVSDAITAPPHGPRIFALLVSNPLANGVQLILVGKLRAFVEQFFERRRRPR